MGDQRGGVGVMVEGSTERDGRGWVLIRDRRKGESSKTTDHG